MGGILLTTNRLYWRCSLLDYYASTHLGLEYYKSKGY